MASDVSSEVLFRQADPDRYILTSDESVALGAAWRVLQAFDLEKNGKLAIYDDSSQSSTFDYLKSGGEERPYAGIFAVEVRESWDDHMQTDLHVSNRNGIGSEEYRAVLRRAVETVGIMPSE